MTSGKRDASLPGTQVVVIVGFRRKRLERRRRYPRATGTGCLETGHSPRVPPGCVARLTMNNSWSFRTHRLAAVAGKERSGHSQWLENGARGGGKAGGVTKENVEQTVIRDGFQNLDTIPKNLPREK